MYSGVNERPTSARPQAVPGGVARRNTTLLFRRAPVLPSGATAVEAVQMAKRKLETINSSSGSTAESPMQFWLLKSEPDDYSIDMLQRDGSTCWDGVRNAVARKNMRAMREGDSCLFYHSSCGKHVGVVGTCTVCRPAYPDPADAKWSCVDVQFGAKFSEALLLPALKAEQDGSLQGLALFRQPRLSVQPVSAAHYAHILLMAGLPSDA